MTTTILTILVFVVGAVVGAVFHAALAKEAAATKTDLAVWTQELRDSLLADAETGKAKVRQLILKLEAKL